jgi:hypothetical protein
MCIVVIGHSLSAGSYKILVGNGGGGIGNGYGKDSEIYFNNNIKYRTKGGGVGGGQYEVGGNGGCGGGAGTTTGANIVLYGGTAIGINYVNGILVNTDKYTPTYASVGYKGGNQDNFQSPDGSGGGGIGRNYTPNMQLDNGGNATIGLNQVTIY